MYSRAVAAGDAAVDAHDLREVVRPHRAHVGVSRASRSKSLPGRAAEIDFVRRPFAFGQRDRVVARRRVLAACDRRSRRRGCGANVKPMRVEPAQHRGGRSMPPACARRGSRGGAPSRASASNSCVPTPCPCASRAHADDFEPQSGLGAAEFAFEDARENVAGKPALVGRRELRVQRRLAQRRLRGAARNTRAATGPRSPHRSRRRASRSACERAYRNSGGGSHGVTSPLEEARRTRFQPVVTSSRRKLAGGSPPSACRVSGTRAGVECGPLRYRAAIRATRATPAIDATSSRLAYARIRPADELARALLAFADATIREGPPRGRPAATRRPAGADPHAAERRSGSSRPPRASSQQFAGTDAATSASVAHEPLREHRRDLAPVVGRA